MKIQLIRHATLLLYINNKKFLIDPMLSPAGTLQPILGVPNKNYNPLVELPINIDNIIDCDAIVITHAHRDHFDDAAAELLPKNIPLFCQPHDKKKFISLGFNEVISINTTYSWNGFNFRRTKGKHGRGIIGLKMAPTSGFIISTDNEPCIYIMGDTIWCSKVSKSIKLYNPDVVISNCGSAQFSHGSPITMSTQDILSLHSKYPKIKVIAVHMESWNHCRLYRKDLISFLNGKELSKDIFVPQDGETLNFGLLKK